MGIGKSAVETCVAPVHILSTVNPWSAQQLNLTMKGWGALGTASYHMRSKRITQGICCSTHPLQR